MLDITALGWFHTALGLIAVAAGFTALFKHRQIGMDSSAGRAFYWFTVATCLTSLFIFRHGGFGIPHVLSLLTLLVLAIGWLAERRASAAGLARYIAPLAYLLALYFHFIPGFTETLIRIPVGHPWASGIEDPRLRIPIGIAFLVFLLVAVWQVFRLRARVRQAGNALT